MPRTLCGSGGRGLDSPDVAGPDVDNFGLIIVALLLVIAGGYVLNYVAQYIAISGLAYVGVKIAEWLFALGLW
jgi:hypothetical protein